MKKNIFKFLSAAALVGVTTLSLTSCKFVDTIKGWFDDDPVTTTETPTTSDNVTVDGTDVEQGTSVPLPKQAIFKKASHRTALTVKATVLPEDATQKTLTWSLAWKTTSSETISNYVTISPSADTLSCSITVKKGFNVPINLKATSKDGISATCQLDFLKQVQSFNFKSIHTDEGCNSQGSFSSSNFTYTFGQDTINYSEYDDNCSTFGDQLMMWTNTTYLTNKYYGEWCYSYFVNEYNINTVGTVGQIEMYNYDNSSLTSDYPYFDISFTDAAITALTNAGYSNYIQSTRTCAGDEDDGNLVFKLINSSSTDIQTNMLKVLKNVQGDIVKFTFEFHSVYNNTSQNVQTLVYSCRPGIDAYVPTTSISFDNSTIVAS